MANMSTGLQSFTVGGDGSYTLGQIAANLYGDASLWTYIQDANSGLAGMGADKVLTGGLRLNAPNLWQTRIAYDGNGNVVQKVVGFGGAIGTKTTNSYYENNVLYRSTTESTWTAKGTQTSLNNHYAQLGSKGHVNTSLAVTNVTSFTMDASGRTLTMTQQNFSNFRGGAPGVDAVAGQQDTSTFTYSYNGGGQLLSIRGSGAKDASGVSTLTYNANGEQVAITQGQGDGMARAQSSRYVYNTDGKIIYQQRDDGQKRDTLERISYEHNGVTGGQLGETGVYADGQYHTYLDGGSYARVEQITPSAVGNGQGAFTANGGETLRQVAQQTYGNAALWYLIANANGMSGDSTLKAGQQIAVTTGLTTGQSNDTTTKPYNAGDIEGSNLPNLKTPAPSSRCGGFGTILMVVVAIAVTVYTAGAAAAYFGAGAGGFSGGVAVLTGAATSWVGTAAGAAIAAGSAFAGSVASQEFGKSIGVVDHFSLRQAVGSGVAAGLTAGIGTVVGSGTEVVKAAANAIVASAVVQRAEMLLHLQERFDWAGLAAAGITAGVMATEAARAAVSNIGQRLGGALADTDFALNQYDQHALLQGVAAAGHYVLGNTVQNRLVPSERRRSLNVASLFSATANGVAYAGDPMSFENSSLRPVDAGLPIATDAFGNGPTLAFDALPDVSGSSAKTASGNSDGRNARKAGGYAIGKDADGKDVDGKDIVWGAPAGGDIRGAQPTVFADSGQAVVPAGGGTGYTGQLRPLDSQYQTPGFAVGNGSVRLVVDNSRRMFNEVLNTNGDSIGVYDPVAGQAKNIGSLLASISAPEAKLELLKFANREFGAYNQETAQLDFMLNPSDATSARLEMANSATTRSKQALALPLMGASAGLGVGLIGGTSYFALTGASLLSDTVYQAGNIGLGNQEGWNVAESGIAAGVPLAGKYIVGKVAPRVGEWWSAQTAVGVEDAMPELAAGISYRRVETTLAEQLAARAKVIGQTVDLGANSASEARGLIPRVDVADKFVKEPLSNGGLDLHTAIQQLMDWTH